MQRWNKEQRKRDGQTTNNQSNRYLVNNRVQFCRRQLLCRRQGLWGSSSGMRQSSSHRPARGAFELVAQIGRQARAGGMEGGEEHGAEPTKLSVTVELD